jgi:hypothetical protein
VLGSLTKQLKMTGDAKQTKIIITQMMTMMLTPHSDSRLGRAYADVFAAVTKQVWEGQQEFLVSTY